MSNTENDLVPLREVAEQLGIDAGWLQRRVEHIPDRPFNVTLVQGIPLGKLLTCTSQLRALRNHVMKYGGSGFVAETAYTAWFRVAADGDSYTGDEFASYQSDDVVSVAEAQRLTGIPFCRDWFGNHSPRRILPQEDRYFITRERLTQVLELAPKSGGKALANLACDLNASIRETPRNGAFLAYVNQRTQARREERKRSYGSMY